MIDKQLSKFFDEGRWISNDRNAAFISSRNNSILQIDYHGKQPVSKNAKIFYNENGVFKFLLDYKTKEKHLSHEIVFDKVSWNPNEIIVHNQLDKLSYNLSISLLNRSLLIVFETSNFNSYEAVLELNLIWNKESGTNQVHGNRIWQNLNLYKNRIETKATDQIYVKEWLKREGPYSGDFLIPEAFRRMIFKKNIPSGQATYEDLKDEYRDSDLLLYDSEIFLIMGGKKYEIIQEDKSVIFKFRQILQSGKISTFEPFILTFGDSRNKTLNNFGKIKKSFRNLNQSTIKHFEKIEDVSPLIEIGNYKEIEEFFSITPGIVESARIKSHKMIRACAGSYYWFWAWDSMVTALEFTRWNNSELQKDIIKFIRLHRDINGNIPMQWSRELEPMDTRNYGVHDFLLALLVFHSHYHTRDLELIRSNYPQLIFSFDQLYKSRNDSGFFPTSGMYPDFPEKMGREKDGFTTMEEASFYAFAILINHASSLMNDPLNFKKSKEVIEKISENFIKCFFDIEKGFLVDSTDKDFKKCYSYPLFSLLFCIFPTSLSLIRNNIENITQFILDNHYEANGIALIPNWDKNRSSETATSGWYPFWDLVLIKLLRRQKKSEAIKLWLGLIQRCYTYFGYCPEYVSLKLEDIDKGSWMKRGTAWNLNCTTAWYHCLIEGLFGIEEDIGGVTYIPSNPVDSPLHLSNIYLKGIKSNVEIYGNGNYVKEFTINDEVLSGAMKIPIKYYNSKKLNIKIFHSEQKPDILITEMNGASLLSIQILNNKITAKFQGYGYLEIVIEAKSLPVLLIDNEKQSLLWNESNQTGSFSGFFTGRHNLETSI